MQASISDADDIFGTVEYFPEENRVEVHHPNGDVQKITIEYLNGNLQNFENALKEMFSHIGVHALWGEVRDVIRTVPYDPTQSQEGLLIDKDGSIIYDDSWMHRDNENNK